jgi:hypothetical protein
MKNLLRSKLLFLILLMTAANAFGQFMSSDSSTPDAFYALTQAAPAALSAGDAEKAKSLANELLRAAPNWKKDWNYGNAIHTANIVLGRVALQSGDKDLAQKHLLAAGETPGSPQLDSFGPDMLFAKEMLEAGERDIVLKYFDLCEVFWKRGDSKIETWRAAVEEGIMPDFGPNLRYVFPNTVQAAR